MGAGVSSPSSLSPGSGEYDSDPDVDLGGVDAGPSLTKLGTGPPSGPGRGGASV